jgi:hypothetical protein
LAAQQTQQHKQQCQSSCSRRHFTSSSGYCSCHRSPLGAMATLTTMAAASRAAAVLSSGHYGHIITNNNGGSLGYHSPLSFPHAMATPMTTAAAASRAAAISLSVRWAPWPRHQQQQQRSLSVSSVRSSHVTNKSSNTHCRSPLCAAATSPACYQ